MTDSGKAYFDSLGSDWDELQESFFSKGVRDKALDTAGVSAGGIAADLGAGTGFVTTELVERGIRVVAVDQSQVMLDALRRKLPWPEKVQVRRGSAERLPVDDGEVDYCFSNMYLHHVESPERAIAEMARILRPGGRVVITDLDAHDHAFLREEHRDRWMGFERDDVRRWLREADLVDARVDCLGEDCCATSNGGEDAQIGIFVASATKP